MMRFVLDERKLREEFANDDEGWIEPFDPMKVDADELHRVVDACLEREVIARPNPRAWLAVYPLSISEPEPLLSVNPGEGPLLLGGSVVFDVGDERRDKTEESVVILSALVEAANALYRESELGKASSKGSGTGPEEFIRLVYTEEDVRQWAEESGGAVSEVEALERAREWGSHIQDTAARLCSEQLMAAVLEDQP